MKVSILTDLYFLQHYQHTFKYASVSAASFINKLVQYNPKTLLITCNYMSYHLGLAKKT